MKFHDSLVDPLLGNLGAPSFKVWHVVARLIDGDAHLLDAEQLEIAQTITGRTRFPPAPREIWIGVGRRSGKSLFSSRIGVWQLAEDHREHLAAGEIAHIGWCAPDRSQASLIFGYMRGCIAESPLLSAQVASETADSIEMVHRSRLEVTTASYRAQRGRSQACSGIDEAAFLRSEDAPVSGAT